MELVLFIGIPGSGKSSFYLEHFFRTHVRVNLDMLRTRHREELLIQACLAGKTRFVVDNTNLTRESRAPYIQRSRSAGFAVHGYFFESNPAEALARNSRREADARVPPPAIYGSQKRLQAPILAEGFDRLFVVRLQPERGFVVESLNG